MRPGRFRHIVFSGFSSPSRVNMARDARSVPVKDRWGGTLSEDDELFVRWLFRNGGIGGGAYRFETLRRRLPACLRAVRAQSTAHAKQLLQDTPELIRPAMGAMVLGVTWFFRDAEVFDHLRHSVLPALTSSRPRIWSAGCSDGAELYSIAISLAELGLLDGSRLLGTD